MTLEADGIIDVWEIETGKMIAQYEGLEVHEDMQSIPNMKRRIVELEKTVTEATERISYLNTTNSMRRTTIEEQTARIAELEATVARLEAEAKQRFDYTPVTLLRYIVNSHPSLSVDDRITARRWLDSLDGDA